MAPSRTTLVSESTTGVDSAQMRLAAFRDREIRLLELLAGGATLPRILESVTRMIQAQSPGTIASVLVLDPDGVHLRHGAGPDLPEDYRNAIDGGAIGPSAGSCGTAVFRRERVIVSDIAKDPLWADYKDLALQHGLRACWSEPIFDSKRDVLGSFAMYHRQVSEPTGDDLRNIRVAAHVAGIAIERERTEEACQTAERERERMERHIAERSLAEAGEQRFRALAETANDGIISADGEGMIIGWNRAARTMFGYGDDEVLGKPLTILMSEHYRAAHLQGLARFQSSGEGRLIGHTIEVQGQRKDGAEFPIELSLSTWTTGGKRFFAGIIRDITERKRTEEELKRAMAELARSNADLDQFAHVASHDLQEPLRTVAGFVQLLERNGRGKLDADAGEWIRLALEGTKRMQQLIQDLLAYARVSTRGRHFEQTDSGAALDYALANLAVAISESGASVTHDPMPVLNADPAQLTQLFQNLIGNGVKFRIATRPEIHVGAQQKNGDWVFSVRDNGIGIEPKDRDRVFVIFQRLHSRDEYPGTGIGLAICKRIVERHGGRIWVESEPGKGSTLFFTIPRKVDPPREGGAPSPKTDGAS